MALEIITNYMTRNDCYTANRKIEVKGLMLHSTATPGVMAKDWFTRWNKSYKAKEINRQVCVHGFIDDKECYQYLPWDHRGWHAGGKANDTHIGVEMCEPKNLDDKEYFKRVYDNAVELFAKLCREYNLTADKIITHSEGYKLGIASNHADVMHWFPRHNKTMDDFRTDVANKLSSTPQWKIDLYEEAMKERLITDTTWKDKLDEPAPVWFVLALATRAKGGENNE